jgi:hypothetical protein
MAPCPHGCGAGLVRKAFRTPPGGTSARTKFMDKTLQTIANDFGMSDMNNDHGQGAAKINRKPTPMEGLSEFSAKRLGLDGGQKFFGGDGVHAGWGHVAAGASYDPITQKEIGEKRDGGANTSLGSLNAADAGSGLAKTDHGPAVVMQDGVAATLSAPKAIVDKGFDYNVPLPT